MTPPKNPRKNFKLLWTVYNWIVDHPKEWDQSAWGSKSSNVCGTAFCFAGFATVIGRPGAKLLWEQWQYFSNDDEQITAWSLEEVVAGGKTFGIEAYSTKILGLSEWEADLLFGAGNTLLDLKNILTKWERDEIHSGRLTLAQAAEYRTLKAPEHVPVAAKA